MFRKKIIFRCGHLNGKLFDETVLTGAKSVVNMALGAARGNVEQNFCYVLIEKILWKNYGDQLKKLIETKVKHL